MGKIRIRDPVDPKDWVRKTVFFSLCFFMSEFIIRESSYSFTLPPRGNSAFLSRKKEEEM
jgi:hypothetical protein